MTCPTAVLRVSTSEAFAQGMRELGYVEGRNLIVEYRWAARKEERLPELAAELVRLKVEIIVTAAAPRVPDALIKQLADGGRIVIPVGVRDGQTLSPAVRRP